MPFQMKLFYMINVFFPEGEILLAPLKKTSVGYYLEDGPKTLLETNSMSGISEQIFTMMEYLAREPQTDRLGGQRETAAEARERRDFCRKHQCVCVKLFPQEDIYEVVCLPQMKNGTYGHYKGVTDDVYNKYTCRSDDADALERNISLAREDAERWLQIRK